MELRLGDSDNKSIWGGAKQNQAPTYTVKSLQTELHAIGVYSDKIDGDFGGKTEKALKLFQWCLKNSVHVVKKGSLVVYSSMPSTLITGRCDESTQAKLKSWVKNQYIVTGDLVRISTTNLSNIELSPNFSLIGQPVVGKSEFVISRTAVPMIKLMNETAKKLNVIISINQVLRIFGNKVTGSVVSPATKSQHYIGHAIDCNIVDGSNWNTASDFQNQTQTSNADQFISAMKKANYRWGGDFTTVDTPHFDKELNANTFDYDAEFFLNQKQITSGDPIEKLLIP
ncbi:MAG: hypothetical protein GC149_01690 [Gammaproteobacteria bacterium]|nr:hypothetical protein [Gammaproteobacteria bacterium]